jgi:hypothetical protein
MQREEKFPSPKLVIALGITTVIFALAIGMQINAVVEEQQAVQHLQAEVESYDLIDADLHVNYLFSNVTADIEGHIEAQGFILSVENRTVVNQTVNSVDMVDIEVDKGQENLSVTFENIVPTADHYMIESRLVTKTMVRRLPEVYIFEKEEE